MVDRDGTAKYSNVKVIKLNGSNAVVNVSIYPNPTTNELKVTIPANWQNQAVTYEMISLSGVVVKQYVNQHASQTESIVVSHLQSGNYLLRVRAGGESSVQMLSKK